LCCCHGCHSSRHALRARFPADTRGKNKNKRQETWAAHAPRPGLMTHRHSPPAPQLAWDAYSAVASDAPVPLTVARSTASAVTHLYPGQDGQLCNAESLRRSRARRAVSTQAPAIPHWNDYLVLRGDTWTRDNVLWTLHCAPGRRAQIFARLCGLHSSDVGTTPCHPTPPNLPATWA